MQAVLAAPFDALRRHHAEVVSAGLLPRSSIASGRIERQLNLLETLMLGPFARHR